MCDVLVGGVWVDGLERGFEAVGALWGRYLPTRWSGSCGLSDLGLRTTAALPRALMFTLRLGSSRSLFCSSVSVLTPS